MSAEKIHPRLAAEMSLAAHAGQGERVFPVIVQHSPGGSTAIFSQLKERGAVGEPLPLVDAFQADLTSAQIRELAARADVTIILLNRPEHVTT